MPGDGGPTVPILIRSGGLTAPTPHVSDMPHSSASGTPIALKKTSTSRGVGAAPALTAIAWSSPSIARSPANSCSSPAAAVAATASGTGSPACSSSTRSRAASSQATVSSPCVRRWPSSPAFSFSKMRGTAKNQVGLTAGR